MRLNKERLAALRTWEELPYHVQEDLTEWLNIREPDSGDRAQLATLFDAGRFHAWNCPTCGERVRSGEPEDWAYFQGVCEPDHSSYPGDPDTYTEEIIPRQCDDCRMSVGHLVHTDEPEY